MKTFGEELSPILEEIENKMWEYEANNEDTPARYTDLGFRAANKIFIATLWDKMWALCEKENIPFKDRIKMVTYAGNKLRKFVKEMTNIDTRKLYK